MLTLLASLRNFNDEKKNVFDGERCTKAFMKTYGHSWASKVFCLNKVSRMPRIAFLVDEPIMMD